MSVFILQDLLKELMCINATSMSQILHFLPLILKE